MKFFKVRLNTVIKIFFISIQNPRFRLILCSAFPIILTTQRSLQYTHFHLAALTNEHRFTLRTVANVGLNASVTHWWFTFLLCSIILDQWFSIEEIVQLLNFIEWKGAAVWTWDGTTEFHYKKTSMEWTKDTSRQEK